MIAALLRCGFAPPGERHPQLPIVIALLQAPLTIEQVSDVLCGAFGRISIQIHRLERSSDHLEQGRVAQGFIRLRQVLQQLCGIGRGGCAQLLGRYAVLSRLIAHLAHLVLPSLLPQAVRQLIQLSHLSKIDDLVQRLCEEPMPILLAQHGQRWRQAQLEREPGQQALTHDMHGADERPGDPLRDIDPTRLNQAAAHALVELGRGLDRERRRDDFGRIHAVFEQRFLQLLGQPIRLPAPSARADEGDVAEIGHSSAAQPVRCEKSS